MIISPGDLKFNAYKAQNQYKYLQVRCIDCKATLTCGNRKDNPSLYYYRRNDDGSLQWEEYKGSDSKPAEKDDKPDDIPF